jgi:ribonuclease III
VDAPDGDWRLAAAAARGDGHGDGHTQRRAPREGETVSDLSGDGQAADADTADLLQALQVPLGGDLLERALVHRSFAYENGGLPTNERLEFLGDSVLGLIVTDTLFREYPDLPEGQLAKLRAAVVNMRALAGVARGLRLGSYIRLGKGEEGTGGRDKSSILADTLEAVIGAVYVDRGLAAADELVHRLFDPVIARSARLGAGLDWKTSLQELTAAEILGVPEYHVEESGPDHQKSFRASVRIGGRAYGEGEGHSKKEAEQQAAEAAWTSISEALSARAGGDGGRRVGGNGGALSARARGDGEVLSARAGEVLSARAGGDSGALPAAAGGDGGDGGALPAAAGGDGGDGGALPAAAGGDGGDGPGAGQPAPEAADGNGRPHRG